MDDGEISFLFANDDVYAIPDIGQERTEINADLLLLASTKGQKENCEQIIKRLLQSLASLNNNICVQYDPIVIPFKHNCKRIVAMGYSIGNTGVHADFAFNKIILFKEKYILLTDDLLTIDREAVKKKQFWKLLRELLACGN